MKVLKFKPFLNQKFSLANIVVAYNVSQYSIKIAIVRKVVAI